MPMLITIFAGSGNIFIASGATILMRDQMFACALHLTRSILSKAVLQSILIEIL
jgi:hypothetical protein